MPEPRLSLDSDSVTETTYLMLMPHAVILDEDTEPPKCQNCILPVARGVPLIPARPGVAGRSADRNEAGEIIAPAIPMIPPKPARYAYGPYCDACVAEILAEGKTTTGQEAAMHAQNANQTWWKKQWAWAPGYHATTLAKLPTQAVSRRALAWKLGDTDEDGRPGLLFQGMTGRGKTRTAYLLLLSILNQGHRAEIWPCLKLRHELVRLATHEDKRQRPAFIHRLATAPLLFLDDVGQFAGSNAGGADFLEMLETATMNGTPIIATMQYTGAELIKRFNSAATGEAIVRRLEDFCAIINFDSP